MTWVIPFNSAPQATWSVTGNDPQQLRGLFAQVDGLRADGGTDIYSPVSGEVNKTVVVGMNVQDGQQLLTVVPLDEVWVTANFKETQLKNMRPGQPVKIYVDAYGREYDGHGGRRRDRERDRIA